MAKNGAENGAAPKAKIAKKVGRRTKCTEDYVPRFLERIEAGQSVPAAAAVAGLHISTVMEWLAREREIHAASLPNLPQPMHARRVWERTVWSAR
jgi:hypothetical protein